MHISIHAIGRMKQGPERQLVARYLERAAATGKGLGLSGFEVFELMESRASAVSSRKSEEARALGAGLPMPGLLVALDERGKSITSPALAERIARWRDDGRAALGFIIGGADGLDRPLIGRADLVLSFSLLTWPHQLVRIMLAEQLYRVTTILSGHPYHRGA